MLREILPGLNELPSLALDSTVPGWGFYRWGQTGNGTTPEAAGGPSDGEDENNNHL